MKALLTGAAGFIGSYLAEALVKKGYAVTCLVRKTSDLTWIEHLDLAYLCCDLADVASRVDALGGFDYVFHVAGLTKAASEDDFFFVNGDCTRRLLQVMSSANPGMKRFVYLSSLAAAGPSLDGTPVTEERSPMPVSLYGRSKLEGERAVMEYSRTIPVSVIRPPAVYGPRDRDFHVMFKMIQRGLFPYWGKCHYSLLYVDDLIQGILLAAEKKEAEGRIFFLSDHIVYTNDQLAEEISVALNTRAVRLRLPRSFMPFLAFLGQKIDKKGIINRDKVRELRYSDWICDAGRAKRELGFQSRTTLREGIQWTADWYRIHRWL